MGAEVHERSAERTTHRNGHRERRWDTRLGTLQLQVPKLREGGYIPSFIEHRKRSEQALISVIQEAVVKGVSTRKIEAVLEEFGIAGVSAGQVSQLCAALGGKVRKFREGPLEEHHIPIHCIAGLSAGSIVAAAYASGVTPDEIASAGSSMRFVDVGRFKLGWLGLVDSGRMNRFLRRLLRAHRFEEMRTLLGVLATDLSTGKPVPFFGVSAGAKIPIVPVEKSPTPNRGEYRFRLCKEEGPAYVEGERHAGD